MTTTSFDHVILAAGPEGLIATAERVAAALGATARAGGVHTTYGTRNAIVPLTGGYLEVVAVETPEVAAASPFGSVVARRCADGGGWVGWAVAVEDTDEVGGRLGAAAVVGGRERPDGVRLSWAQVGVEVLADRAWLPFFLRWDVPADLHPAAGGPAGVAVAGLDLAVPTGTDGAADLRGWLDGEPPTDVRWTGGDTRPAGPVAVTFTTPGGPVVVTR
ncbi:VOC family protein [Kineosporia sp. A_224]|uniref:VOC family protein n=1 Tax=Kineosporia sp. A_224 TaxID=1962180 RepID=UPI0013045608|nr:VOC family protein [Kineosporia sp. A_224]